MTAFTRVERDISSYYILGFSSTNANKDGRFRRLTVRLRRRSNLRVEAKDGYYADRDFAHTARGDREASSVPGRAARSRTPARRCHVR